MQLNLQMFHDGCMKAGTDSHGARNVPAFEVDFTDDFAWYLKCPKCGARVSAYINKPE